MIVDHGSVLEPLPAAVLAVREAGLSEADLAVGDLELFDDLPLAAGCHLWDGAAEWDLGAQNRHVGGHCLAEGGLD